MHNNIMDKNKMEIDKLSAAGYSVPDFFTVSSKSYSKFIKSNNLGVKIDQLLSTIHYARIESVMQVSTHLKNLILNAKMPSDLIENICTDYNKMGGVFGSAEVTVDGSKQKIKGEANLLFKIKHIWANQFESKKLLQNRQSLNRHSGLSTLSMPNGSRIANANSIIVQKVEKYKKSGKLHTSDLKILTQNKLAANEIQSLNELAKKLKKHFYFPQIIEWGIHKNKIHILSAKHEVNTQKAYLVLVRHGESVWNAKGLWTGWTDVELSETGHKQAREAGEQIKDIHFDIAYTSDLIRAQQTLDEIQKIINPPNLPNLPSFPTIKNKALNERNYGDMTGKNKWNIEKEFGKKQFMKWRRGWDVPLPNGESLKDVYARVIPYYEEQILPKLKSGKNVIVSAHGNSLRALVKYLEKIPDSQIAKLEIGVGETLVYQIDEDGKVVNKQIRNKSSVKI